MILKEDLTQNGLTNSQPLYKEILHQAQVIVANRHVLMYTYSAHLYITVCKAVCKTMTENEVCTFDCPHILLKMEDLRNS